MPIVIKSLADGQLPNAKAALYTVPALTTAIIRRISLVNPTAGALTTNLYLLKSGGTSRRIMEKDLSIAANGIKREDGIITLGAGDAIEGDASAPTSIDYVISGVERT